jgi:hypothetical protein
MCAALSPPHVAPAAKVKARTQPELFAFSHKSPAAAPPGFGASFIIQPTVFIVNRFLKFLIFIFAG